MHTKFLAFILATSFLVMAGCSEQKAISEDTKSSEVSETEDNMYDSNYVMNIDIFSTLTKRQQREIKKIVDNIEVYYENFVSTDHNNFAIEIRDKNEVFPQNIDKENFVISNKDNDFVVEIGSGDNKVIVLLTNDYENKNKFKLKDVYMANNFKTYDFPLFDEVDFLDDEQKQLFLDAMELLSACHLSPDHFCDKKKTKNAKDREIEVKWGEDKYSTCNYVLCKNDKFSTYDEFKDYVYSIFTKEYWDNIEHVDKSFIEKDGNLYCMFAARGSLMSFLGKNRYELISRTENKIEFYDISYYDWLQSYEGTKPEWTQVVKNKAVLEKIDGEWKFSELVYPL